jgi:hypothetical protein
MRRVPRSCKPDLVGRQPGLYDCDRWQIRPRHRGLPEFTDVREHGRLLFWFVDRFPEEDISCRCWTTFIPH